MYTESELMSRIRSGEIIKMKDFKEYPFDVAQRALVQMRSMYNSTEHQKMWKASGTDLKEFFMYYQVARLRSGEVLVGEEALGYLGKRSKPTDEQIHRVKKPRQPRIPKVDNDIQEVIVESQVQIPTPKREGFELSIARNYTSKSFEDLINRLSYLFDKDMDQTLHIEIKITEVMQND